MNETHNPRLHTLAKQLRKNMTKEERHLWYDFLKDLPMMVHRQKVIGNYIADFYIAQKKLVIELDGSQHYMPEGKGADCNRDAFFQSLEIRVLRYSNAEINSEFESVCQNILQQLER